MNALGSYLLQMACWLAGFWLVYAAFLRNETFFKLNRWFLLTGLAVSVLMPLFPVNYRAEAATANFSAISTVLRYSQVTEISTEKSVNYWLLAYILGVSVFAFRFIWQTFRLRKMRKHAENELSGLAKIYRLDTDTAPFSFFRNIYVSKKLSGDAELKAVIAHEKVHIEERHWADLLLLEMVRAVQWFNPLLIFYKKAILQNHEYLADTGTLQKGVSARTYKAILANQMLGMPVLQIANGFTLFNPNKRITMMNKNRTSSKKRMKLLWALPVAALIMTAFAEPVYELANAASGNEIIEGKTITVKGKVTDENGEPLPGTSIIIAGTHRGTLSDANGKFELEGVLPENEIVFSFVGYKSVQIKASKNIDVQLERKTMVMKAVTEEVAPPPPPTPLVKSINSGEMSSNLSVILGEKVGNSPLVILDKKEYKGKINDIDPNTIAEVSVLKDVSATVTYGKKGENGVVIITSKDKIKSRDEEVFVVVEDMPLFVGGKPALNSYLAKATAGSKDKTPVHRLYVTGVIFDIFMLPE
ncbi:MAG: carboxypeptidase-like regulatory domain-containing protein [Prolixibacteraceae bacterium]|jgi:TonB-dependent SusC/RagA subfamily outer membrane receptor|nr:carboxypeptidase-like regulatory domain-containing protein [Prolixibacteraceae bacterium]